MKLISDEDLKEQIRIKLGVRSLDCLLPSEKAIIDVIDSMPPFDPGKRPAKKKDNEISAAAKILSIKEIQKDCIGDVYTREEFSQIVKDGSIDCFDGAGFYHDGSKRTKINVFDTAGDFTNLPQYPYVCWYNK